MNVFPYKIQRRSTGDPRSLYTHDNRFIKEFPGEGIQICLTHLTTEEIDKLYSFLTEELGLSKYLISKENLYGVKSVILGRMSFSNPLSPLITWIKLSQQYTVDEFISRVTGIEHKDQLNYLQLLSS